MTETRLPEEPERPSEAEQRRGHATETMDRVTVRTPTELCEAVDDLVDDGVFESRSAAFREGARAVVRMHRRGVEGSRRNSQDLLRTKFKVPGKQRNVTGTDAWQSSPEGSR